MLQPASCKPDVAFTSRVLSVLCTSWLCFIWIHSSSSQRPLWLAGLGSPQVSAFTFSSNDSRFSFCKLQSGLVSLWKVLKETLLPLLVEDLCLDDMKISGRRERLLPAAECKLALKSFCLLACSNVRWQRRTWTKTFRNCWEEILYRSGFTTELR